MNYKESIDYLFSLKNRGIKLGLDNTREALYHLGDPQDQLKIIHIAGTNGKGSTAAFVESILRSAGYRVGLFTSPHLLDFRERIQINRELIPEADLLNYIDTIREVCVRHSIFLTFFEYSTIIAFLHFQAKQVDFCVLEVGLGGRLDATNVCHPLVSIITSIAEDHLDILGPDTATIAGEKAAIIKPHGLVVVADIDESAYAVVEEQVKSNKAKMFSCQKDFFPKIQALNESRVFSYQDPELTLEDIQLPLAGDYQAENASLAIKACTLLNELGYCINSEHLVHGLQYSRWEGRMEVIQHNPILLLDCAHNPESVKYLTSTIRDYFSYERCHFILGFMNNKAIAELIDFILDIADRLILVRPRQERSWDPHFWANKWSKSQKVIEIIEEIPYALRSSLQTSNRNDLLCVTGSLFTVSEAKQSLLNERVNQTPGRTPGGLIPG